MTERIADSAWRIILTRVESGKSTGIARTFLAGPNLNGLFVLEALGHCDLVLLCPAERADAIARLGTIDGLLGFSELDCYEWQGTASVAQVLANPLCALVLLRLNPDHAAGGWSELDIEQRLVSVTRDIKRTGSCTLLGTLGSTSGVLLIGDAELAGVLRAMRGFLERTAEVAAARVPWVRRSVFVCGLPYRAAEIAHLSDEAMYDSWQVQRGELSDESATICFDISCRLANVRAVAERARELWAGAAGSSVGSTSGVSDVRVRVPLESYSNFGHAFRDLARFRKTCAAMIRRIDTRFECSAPLADGPADLRPIAMSSVVISPEEAAAIAAIDKESPAILRALYGFTDRLRDEPGSDLRDMAPFYGDRKADANLIDTNLQQLRAAPASGRRKTSPAGSAITHATIQDDLKQLYALLEKGQIGQLQRLDLNAGGSFGMESGPYRSGLRRVLWAANALPWHMLHRVLRDRWGGFVIAGRMKDAFQTVPPVMNFPLEALFEPQQWWGLTHEACHSFVELLSNSELDFTKDPWVSAFESFDEQWGVDEKFYEHLAVECLCDALEAASACVEPAIFDWRAHQAITWAYVLEHSEGRTDVLAYLREHVLRSMFAILFTLSDTRKAADRSEIRTVFEALCDLLDKRFPKNKHILYVESLGDDAVRLGEAFSAVRMWLSRLCKRRGILFFDKALSQDRAAWMRKSVNPNAPSGYDRCRHMLLSGEVVPPDALKHPDLLVWRLQRRHVEKEPLPQRAKTATMLSLLQYFLVYGLSNFEVEFAHAESQTG